MADATQYLFENRELLSILIKNQGLKSGLWTLLIEFNFGATNAGTSVETAIPSAIVGLGRVGLQRAEVEGPMVLDAAKINM